jgi:subtilisin family serine protease
MSRWLPLLIALTVSASTLPVEAAPARPARKDGRDVYIVRMTAPPLARALGGGERRLDAESPASRQYVDLLRKQQGDLLKEVRGRLGREAVALHQYVHAFNGMSLELTREEADRVSKMPGVAGVQRHRTLRPQSDAGPAWAGAPGVWDGSQTGGLPGTQGEGVVVGVIDTGINMDHPSFADVGADGYNHTNPRGAGNYVGWCNPSNPNYSPTYPCNDKLIGVWSFYYYSTSPEDVAGHGTQVASVAAGNHLNVPLTGTIHRSISGVAPHANLISYDICDDYYYCYSDVAIMAIDQAVADGVDVMTLAFGSDYYDGPWYDDMALALLGAREAGIFVAVPAGNGGYWSDAISSTASSPWLLAAGASTHNRRFSSSLTGMSGGNTTPPPTLGSVILTDAFGPAPIVDAANYSNESCYNPFTPGTLNGKIVVCTISYYSDGFMEVANAAAGGAGGVVLVHYYDYSDTVIEPVSYQFPVVRLYEDQGFTLRDWLASGSGHTGRISATVLDTAAANGDIVPDFSSRGPGAVSGLAKPDVLAPGVDILSASSDPRDYAVQSGTSHASAFAAGSAALLIALHPTWTPAEVQSALATTAKWSGLKLADGSPATSPLEIGAGRIDLGAAGRAGLVLNETGTHFEQADPVLGGVPSSLNLATLAAGFCTLSCSWTRTVRSTLSTTSHWTASVSLPPGLTASVVPSSFTLGPGAAQTVQITFNGPPNPLGWVFGSLTFSETAALAPPARLPVATRWVAQRKLTVTKTGAGSGVVTSSPAGINCGPACIAPFPEGTSATLTGTPSPGSAFVGWGGYCYYGNEPCTINFYSYDQQISAYFDIQPPDRSLANRVGFKDGMNPPVEGGTWRYYYFDVPAGTGEAVVDLIDLSGDVTLFVKQGAKPDDSHYDCYDSNYYDLRNRRCVMSDPAAGRWWVGVRNEQTGPIQYSARASWGSVEDQPLQNGIPQGGFVSSQQPGAAWKYYYADLTGESSELVVDLKNLSADADLFVRRGAKPDRSNYDCTSENVGTAAERCTLARPEAGRWWIAVNNFSAGTITYTALAAWTATGGADFHTVAPCRLVDTRSSYPLQANQSRSFLAAGYCGIPATATAVALNVTVVNATGGGFLTLYPDNLSVPVASSINFSAAVTRANSSVVRLSTDGEGRIGVYPVVSEGGVVDVILDVAGYFE